MGKVSRTIAAHRLAVGKDAKMERSSSNRYLEKSIFSENRIGVAKQEILHISGNEERLTRPFAPAGQSTQMIIGASEETDYNLIQTTQKLYQAYDLKRVFYSAYIPINEDSNLPGMETPPPLLREHRLYQADWLLRFYGFEADELLSEERPNFNEQLDPKCDWALRHLELFPIEIQTASYDVILRVPGIGPKSAGRIIKARRYGRLDFDMLKKMGVVLKRAHYFITCSGKMMYQIPIEEQYITRQLTATNARENWQIAHQEQSRQMSLFDDFGVKRG
jgi:predicted DNA-binding helix-hairpin-helix protein